MITISADNIFSIVLPVLTFFLGAFFMSKKERKDHNARLIEYSNNLNNEHTARYQEYAKAIASYSSDLSPQNDISNFVNIAVSGDAYFQSVKNICDAILSGNIDKQAIKNTHVPLIIATIEQVLPKHYEKLQDIAKKINYPYNGRLQEGHYKSIYEVYRKYKDKC